MIFIIDTLHRFLQVGHTIVSDCLVSGSQAPITTTINLNNFLQQQIILFFDSFLFTLLWIPRSSIVRGVISINNLDTSVIKSAHSRFRGIRTHYFGNFFTMCFVTSILDLCSYFVWDINWIKFVWFIGFPLLYITLKIIIYFYFSLLLLIRISKRYL